MKKGIIISLITAAVLFVLGIVFIVAGLIFGGSLLWGVSINDGKLVENSGIMLDGEEILDEFDKIVSDTNSLNVYLQPGDSYKIEYHVSEEDMPSIEVKDNTLHVKQKNNAKIGIFSAELHEQQYVIISVPNDNKEYTVDMSITADSIEIKDIFASGKVELTSGKAKIYNVVSDDFSLTMTSGKTEIDKLVAASVTLELTSGSMTASNVFCDTISESQSSGGFKGKNIDALRITSELTSGNADWELVGRETDYNWKLEKTSGNIKIDDQSIKGDTTINNNADKSFAASLTSGGIAVTFTE